jgi:hypothetical protein
MSYLGDFRLGDTLDFKFTTVQTTGAPFTLAGGPVVSAYPGNSLTELTAGITLTQDFDGRTGLNNVRVVASGGNGYATATNYELVITTGTVNSVSVVGYVVGTFSIENRSALMPTTSGRTLVVDASGLADANTVKVGPTGSGTAQTASNLSALLTTALTESYNTDGSSGTAAQLLYLIVSRLMEFDISGTSITMRKLDGTTQSAILTLNDATNPTTCHRTT